MGKNEKRSNEKIVIGIINILLCIAGAVGCCVILFGENEGIYKALAVIEILSLAFNLIYTLRGFRKRDAVSFRLFMLLAAVVSLTKMTSTCADPDNVCSPDLAITVGIIALQFAALVVLAFGKDLGIVLSSVFCSFIILVPLFTFTSSFRSGNYDVMANLGFLASSASSVLLVLAKYVDKYQRKADTDQKI